MDRTSLKLSILFICLTINMTFMSWAQVRMHHRQVDMMQQCLDYESLDDKIEDLIHEQPKEYRL